MIDTQHPRIVVNGRMALAVNGKYRHADLTQNDLAAEVRSWGLNRADAIVTDAIDELLTAIEAEQVPRQAHPMLSGALHQFSTNLQAGRPCGVPPSGR